MTSNNSTGTDKSVLTSASERRTWLKTQPNAKFSNSWFWGNTGRTRQILRDFANGLQDGDLVRAVEIGSFEGQSTLWLASELGAFVTCVDPFELCSAEHVAESSTFATPEEGLLPRFSSNLDKYLSCGQVQIHRNYSFNVLPELYLALQSYNLAYIDGSHNANDVLTDAVLCDQVLEVGGLIVFDDYRWGCHKTMPELAGTLPPKPAIDALIKLWTATGKYNLLDKRQQVTLQKCYA